MGDLEDILDIDLEQDSEFEASFDDTGVGVAASAEAEQQEHFPDLDLEVVDNSEFASALSDPLEYPCILLRGIETVEELQFFAKRYCEEESALPLFIEVEGQIKRIGMFSLTLDSLLSVRCISPYDISLYRSETDVVKLDLNDTTMLMKFSKISR